MTIIPKKRLTCLLAAALLLTTVLSAQIRLRLTLQVRQGSPMFVQVDTAPALLGVGARLVYANGTRSPLFPVYAPERAFRAVDLAQAALPQPIVNLGGGNQPAAAGAPVHNTWLLAVHPDAPPGPATVLLLDAAGAELAQASITILPRGYLSEDIALTPSLTSLRADPDPVKEEQARRYNDILARVDPAAVYLDSPFIRPVTSERRTSFYGDRRRYLYSTGAISSSMHAGIDYGVPSGTPVVAAGRGRVVMAEARLATGNTIILEHLPGVYSIYMHLDSLACAVGDLVPRGWLIGAVGMTGLATGPHLHWELRVSRIALDPEAMLAIDNFPEIGTIHGATEGR